MTNPTACLIIIGNEILSGRTQDKNLSFVATQLNGSGIRLAKAIVIPDIEEEIITTINEARIRFDYVFTTGGIGPTHDDITTAAIAKAFGVKVVRHEEAERRLRLHYTADKLNAARLKMADIPEGAGLIDNPVSSAPGFYMENVFVLAGVPEIMQAMFLHIRHVLKGGKPTLSKQLVLYTPEGDIADILTEVQQDYPQTDIGCYPFMKQGKIGTTVVARFHNEKMLQEIIDKLIYEFHRNNIKNIEMN